MAGRFSRRIVWPQEPNRFSAALQSAPAAIDLAETNPTRVGLGWSEQALQGLYAAARLGTYQPDPRGTPEALEAIAAYHSRGGLQVRPEALIPTASTSEAYAFVLKLLCDPGDEVLTLTPGYPLLQHLAEVEGVRVVECEARASEDWALPLAEIAERLAAPEGRIRVVAQVNPQHPAGRFVRAEEWDALFALCAAHGAALLSDEVFADYPAEAARAPLASLAGRPAPVLTFTLSGLSKVAALPQAKLGWICVGGPPAAQREALARLEFLSDTFLSVSGPALAIAPRALGESAQLRLRITERLSANRACLLGRRPADAPWDVLPSEGGWSVLLRIPRHPGEEAVALAALEGGVIVQPGHFFDLQVPSLVLSLLPGPEAFTAGIDRLTAVL